MVLCNFLYITGLKYQCKTLPISVQVTNNRSLITQMFCDAKTLKVYFEFIAKTFPTEVEIPVL